MKPTIGRAIAGGLAGTIVFSLMMKFIAPMMLGHPMDIPAMIARMLGVPDMVGMVMHLGLGIIVFPLTYVFAFQFLKGPTVARGMEFAFGLFIVAESVIMPMAGNGFWSADIGGAKAVMAAFIGHMVYGALLGGVAGEASRTSVASTASSA